MSRTGEVETATVRETRIRESFAEQAYWCERLGSPLTASLCRLLGERLERGTSVGRKVLDWPGDPLPTAEALALRLCAGLHWLVRRGAAPDLAALYPPSPPPAEEELWPALENVLAARSDALAGWIERPPQTNEVGRAALLTAGLLVLARSFPLPVSLYELGASAGLNLLLDRFGYDLGGVAAGDPGSPVQLRPDWRGAPPPAARIEVAGGRGVDLNPARLPADRDRLIAYVWPDQPRRLDQIEAALAIAAGDPPLVDQADAADWIERRLAPAPQAGLCRVVLHSVAFQYFPPASQRRVEAHLEAVGAEARADAPLAWLRFEKLPQDDRYSLRLRRWPGEDRLLAWGQPHGGWIDWLAG